MQSVTLSEQEWQSLIGVVANAVGSPWTVTNPLLMKIGQQLQEQQGTQAGPVFASRPGNSHDDQPSAEAAAPGTDFLHGRVGPPRNR